MTTEYKHLKLWTRPSHYMGATWYDYYPLAGQMRDSSALEQSNFRSWVALLKAKAVQLGAEDVPNPDYAPESKEEYGASGHLTCDETIPAWTIERSSHWAVGWVETLLIHKTAHKDLLSLCDATLERLDDYPVVDSDDFSDLETEQANEVWKSCFNEVRRLKYIRDHRSEFEFSDFADLMGCVRGKYFAGYASELLA